MLVLLSPKNATFGDMEASVRAESDNAADSALERVQPHVHLWPVVRIQDPQRIREQRITLLVHHCSLYDMFRCKCSARLFQAEAVQQNEPLPCVELSSLLKCTLSVLTSSAYSLTNMPTLARRCLKKLKRKAVHLLPSRPPAVEHHTTRLQSRALPAPRGSRESKS